MRSLQNILAIVAILPATLAASDSPTVKTGTAGTLPNYDIVLPVSGPPTFAPINLLEHFELTGITGQAVQFNTSKGIINVEMSSVAPNTVANFLSYVDGKAYANSIIHRSDKPIHIFQGGSFLNNGSLSAIATGSAIAMEAGNTLAHTRGTIAMARSSSIDSATSGWFFNTADNSGQWLPASAQSPNSYAGFGRVLQPSLSVMDAVAALPVAQGTLTVVNSSTSSQTVVVASASLPANFGAGWQVLGQTVASVSGSVVTLGGNANQNITSATPVTWSRLSGDFAQLPLLTPLPATNDIFLNNLVTVNSISRAKVFPTTVAAVVTSSATNSKQVVLGSVPPEWTDEAKWIGAKLLGSTVTSRVGNFVFLENNADRTITSATVVPTTLGDEKNVATFSALNTNPGLIYSSVTGAALEMFYRSKRGGVAWLAARAIDSNGYYSQIPFRIMASGGNTVPADVNNDLFDDLLLQNNAGQIYAWLLNGTGATVNFSTGGGLITNGAKLLYGAGLGDWKIVGKADMNSDGIPDIFFQNTAGQIYVWVLDGTGTPVNFSTSAGTKGWGYFYNAALGDWKVADVADVNADGSPDIVLQNTVGQIYVWLLDGQGNGVNFSTGTGLQGWNFLYAAGLGDWRLANCADMNGDGINDLVFQNNVGQIYVWFLNGSGSTVNLTTGAGLVSAVAKTSFLYPSALGDWRIVGCPDVNADGKNDFVFQNTAGQIYVWLLDGTGTPVNLTTQAGLVPGSGYLYPAGLGDWRVR